MIKATFSFIASAHANVLRYAFKKKKQPEKTDICECRVATEKSRIMM